MPRRHSKNSCTQAFFSNYEREQAGGGTKEERLGGDSLRDFDCCWLCLQPAIHPVCLPSGALFCRVCLLENLATQKEEYERKFAEYEKQIGFLSSSVKKKAAEVENAVVEQFERIETSIVPVYIQSVEKAASNASIVFANPLPQLARRYSEHDDQTQQLILDELSELDRQKKLVAAQDISSKKSSSEKAPVRAYWAGNNIPDSELRLLKRPRDQLIDPVTGDDIHMKNITSIKFELSNDRNTEENLKIHRSGVYQCWSCKSTFSNTLSAVVLRKCGHAICVKCFALVGKKDPICPICSTKYKPEKHIIRLLDGGTGYAGHDKDALVAKKYSSVPVFT